MAATLFALQARLVKQKLDPYTVLSFLPPLFQRIGDINAATFSINRNKLESSHESNISKRKEKVKEKEYTAIANMLSQIPWHENILGRSGFRSTVNWIATIESLLSLDPIIALESPILPMKRFGPFNNWKEA